MKLALREYRNFRLTKSVIAQNLHRIRSIFQVVEKSLYMYSAYFFRISGSIQTLVVCLDNIESYFSAKRSQKIRKTLKCLETLNRAELDRQMVPPKKRPYQSAVPFTSENFAQPQNGQSTSLLIDERKSALKNDLDSILNSINTAQSQNSNDSISFPTSPIR